MTPVAAAPPLTPVAVARTGPLPAAEASSTPTTATPPLAHAHATVVSAGDRRGGPRAAGRRAAWAARLGAVGAHTVMAFGMVALVVTGPSSIAGVALVVTGVCLATAFVLAPAARTAWWARATIVDLWAMALLTLPMAGRAVGALPSGGTGDGAANGTVGDGTSASLPLLTGVHHLVTPPTSAASLTDLATSPLAVVTAWLVVRIALTLARRASPAAATGHDDRVGGSPTPATRSPIGARSGRAGTAPSRVGSGGAHALALVASAVQLALMLALH
ncbi:hypothetical protein [Herbiconiux daphne]|uniref:Uncharacterized protein n=1 Tax=Herbiconiux daphne TaxID=2970914 RepID=A0ABT2H3E9_9MICO|nr:hypothetical protein [Herbiconiux daphne]MCS5734468.1 hypothetical protein [Herbiconiux daphne]